VIDALNQVELERRGDSNLKEGLVNDLLGGGSGGDKSRGEDTLHEIIRVEIK